MLKDFTEKNLRRPILWVPSGIYVNESWQNYYYDQYGFINYYGSVNYRIESSLLHNLSTSAWWVSGGSPAETNNISLGEGLTFPNGQYVVVNARGSFSMYKPKLAKIAPLEFGPALVVNNGGYLEVGQTLANGLNNEMEFTEYIQTDFQGTAGIDQLINGQYNNHTTISTDGGYWLDNVSFYDPAKTLSTNSYANNNITLLDSPNIGLSFYDANTVSMNLSFQDYLMFEPSGGSGNNIYVPLTMLTWSVNASATYNGGIWTVNPNSTVTGPTKPVDTTTFPQWTNVFYNTYIP